MNLSRRLWSIVAAALLVGLLLHPQAAFAQSDCTITSAQVPSLTVVRGETNKLVLDTGDANTLAAMKTAGGDPAGTGCNKPAISTLRVETASGTNGVNGTSRPTPVNVTSVTSTGSSFTVSGTQIHYTPGSGVGSSESLSPATGTYTYSGGGPVTDTIHFYHNSQSAGHYYSVQVTIIAPDAPTAALTSLSPNSVYAGNPATVTVTLTNPNTTAMLSGVGDAITLPSQVRVAATPNASTTCGGSVAAAAGGGTVSLSNGSLAANATCTITFNVTATPAGSYTIPSGTPSATGANAGTAGTGMSLTVNAPPNPPTIAAAFSPTSIPANGATGSTLTLTLTNPNGSTALSGVAVGSAALPSGLTGSGIATNCSGGTAALSSGSISLSGATLAASASCTVTLTVKSTSPGSYNYTTGIVSASGPASVTGTTATTPTPLTVVAAPTVTNVTPNSGNTTGGTAVTITGTNLAGASAVTFAGNPATNVVVAGNGNSLTATTPSGTAGAVNVAVTTPGGTGTLAGGYTYIALSPPTVTTQPANQTVAAGATATFTAAASGSPSPTVQWQASVGGGAFADISGATATSYTTPATTAGDNGNQYRAVFTNSQGTATTTAATLTVVQAPTANNQSVTVAFNTATGVTLTASDPNNPPRSLTYSVTGGPAHGTVSAGNGANRTYTPNAGYSGTDSFTFTASNGLATSNTATVSITVQGPAPTVSTVSPNQGSTAGGTAVTITGSAFTGATGVTVGGTPATGVTVVSDTQITATTPAGTAGAASVVVTNTTGSNAANTLFTYVTPATANGQSVNVAFNTATPITLTGNNATSYTVSVNPAQGMLSGSAPNLSYTPNSGYRGTDSFTFYTSNGAGNSAPATVSITVGDPTITISGTPPGGARGAAYSYALTASGGTSPYSFAVTSGALPPGLNLTSSGASGTIAGTPTASGTFTFSVTVTDSTPGNPPVTATQSYSITIAAPSATLNPGSGALPGASVGSGYSQTITTTGAGTTAPYSYSASGTLPAGLTLSSGGVLSGTPTMAGSYSFSVTSTDSSSAGSGGPYATSANYTLNVGGASVSVGPVGGFPAGTVGAAYSQQASASGGTAPYSYAITAGALPAGLTLSTDGTLSGTPTAGGSFTFTLTATDSSTGAGAPFSGSRQYTLTIAAPTLAIAPTQVAAANTNIFYSQMLTASGGTAPYTFNLTAGALPAGITLASNGTLSGTTTQPGNYTFTVQARDSSTGSGPYGQTRDYTLAVTSPTIAIAPATLSNPKVGTAYSQTLTASGGSGSYTYAVTAGALPAGLSLSTGGALSGTPTAGGSFTFTVTATDGNGNTGGRGYTLTVDAATITVAPTSLPGATTRIAYSQTITASGGTAPYSYSVTAGALPAGITLASNGLLSGSATTAGSYTFTVSARDASTGAGPYTSAQGYTLTVTAPAITITPSTLPDATANVSYVQALNASGGTGPYSFAVTAGALPAGITLSTSGALSGKPAAAGQSTFTVTATDTNGNAGTKGYTLTVAAPAITIAPPALPDATTKVSYSQTLSASGGTGPYSFAVTAGALPAGITLSTNGTLSGKPAAAGQSTFTVTATDANGNTGAKGYTLTVATPAISLAPSTLPAATTHVAYSQSITASGGTAPYTFAVTAGALPTGITLATNGALSGSAASAGNFTFTVTATDGNGNAGAQGYTLTVGAPAITLAPTSLANATTGSAYSAAITASGGTAPYSFAVTAGTLPANLTLATDGTLSGTPGAGGTFTFTVTATDANGNAASRGYSLTVDAAQIQLAPASLSAGTSGAAYSQQLSASGGTAPYSYTVTAGALPAGITLASNGTLSGTPAQSGTFTFTATATDSSTGSGPYSAGRSYTLSIAAPALTLTPATLTGATAGAAYNQVLTAAGGTAPYSYAVTAGTLPAGVTLSQGGVLAGTPTAGGNFTFTVTVTDATAGANGGPYSVARSYTLAVAAAQVQIAPASLPGGATGAAYSQQLSAGGGTAPYSYAVTAGALPAGVTLSGAGLLSGSPTQSGSFTFSVTATDSSTGSGPYAGTRSYTLAITAPTLTLSPATLNGGTVKSAYSQTFTTTGGTAPYSYAVTAGALPAGLTLSAGGVLSGTPTANGSFTFTITATDATAAADGGPYRAARSYTLDIALPPPPVAQSPGQTTTTTSTTAAGQPVLIDLSALVSGTYDTIEISTQPQHGTVSLTKTSLSRSSDGSRFIAEYTPNAGYAGSDSFGFVAVGPGGRSAQATVAITVQGTVPVAPTARSATISAQPVTIDLTTGATGGPFTSAQIVSITPSTAVSATLIEGGTAGNRSYQLRVTPDGRFSGTAVIQYTLSNLFGASAPASVTVTVTARPDPSQDAAVRGLSAAQADATKRFATAQTENFMRRTEQLHGGGSASQGSAMGIRVNLPSFGPLGGAAVPADRWSGQSDVERAASGHALEVEGAERASGVLGAPGQRMALTGIAGARGRPDPAIAGARSSDRSDSPTGPTGAGAAASSSVAADGPDGTGGRPIGSVQLWSGGAIQIGVRDATTRRAKLSATSAGLSAGVDIKLADWITVGAGGGYGADRTKLDDHRGRIDSDNWVGVGYASLSPARGLFIDGVFGGGDLSFDTRRAVAANATTALGHRDGSMLFGSVATGFDRTTDAWQLSAYGRIDWFDATLKAYQENSAGIYDLAFARRKLDSLTGVIGLRGAIAMGAWTPRLRAEYRHDFNGASAQALDYAGLAGFSYRIDQNGWVRDALNAEIGTEYSIGIWRFGFDVGGQVGQNTRAATARANIGAKF